MDEIDNRIQKLKTDAASLNDDIADLQQVRANIEQLQAAYVASQVRFKTIFQESCLGKKIINSNLLIVEVNKALRLMLGYAEEELVGRPIMDFAHPDFISHWKSLQHQLWNQESTSFAMDTCLVRKDKTIFWCRVNSILLDDNGEKLGYTILEDIAERKELERVKEEVNQQRLLTQQLEHDRKNQRLLHEITINAQEEERKRIAESLHNGLGQLLFGVKLQLDQVDGSIIKPDKASLEAFEKSKALLAECIRESRRIAHHLMPAILADFGLKEAVLDICRTLSAEVKFGCEITGLMPLDKDIELVIYRSIQELMLNVVKHAEATQCGVKIEANNDSILITIEDNGKGFRPGRENMNGIGLSTIKSRVMAFNGKLHINSKPLKGTVVSIDMPYNPQ
jgi:PAS domain S-box-containing protein